MSTPTNQQLIDFVVAEASLLDALKTVVDPHTVRLATGETFTTKHILIATGGWPFVPDIPGRDLAITSNEVFHLEQLPRRVVISGAGYIAMEFAGIFNALGCEVTVVNRSDKILRGYDEEITGRLLRQYAPRDEIVIATKLFFPVDLAFKGGNALFHNRLGGVHDAGVDVARHLQVEQVGAVLGAVEGVGHRLVDGHGHGLGGGVGAVACVYGQGLDFHEGCLFR